VRGTQRSQQKKAKVLPPIKRNGKEDAFVVDFILFPSAVQYENEPISRNLVGLLAWIDFSKTRVVTPSRYDSVLVWYIASYKFA
jgi:hypothetical protein